MTPETRSPQLRSAVLAKQLFDATDGTLRLDGCEELADLTVAWASRQAGAPPSRYTASIQAAAAKPAGTPVVCPTCKLKGERAPGAKGDAICPNCNTRFDPASGKVTEPPMAASSLAARVRLDRAARALATAGGTSFEAAVRSLTARAK